MANKNKIIEKLKGSETQRGPVNLYLDKPLFTSFKALCRKEGVSASSVLEELMRDFMASSDESTAIDSLTSAEARIVNKFIKDMRGSAPSKKKAKKA